MTLQSIDWTIIGIFIAIVLGIGFVASPTAGKSSQEFFLNPHFPALRSCPPAISGASRNKQIPTSQLMVSGPSTNGMATLLILSAAEKLAETPEKLRVWDSKMHDGAPFVNFNPVMDKSLTLDDANPAVSKREYRVIAADRVIDAAAADAEWRKWTAE